VFVDLRHRCNPRTRAAASAANDTQPSRASHSISASSAGVPFAAARLLTIAETA